VGSLIINLLTIAAESAGERILKISQYLAKLWAKVDILFLTYGVVVHVSN